MGSPSATAKGYPKVGLLTNGPKYVAYYSVRHGAATRFWGYSAIRSAGGPAPASGGLEHVKLLVIREADAQDHIRVLENNLKISMNVPKHSSSK